MENRKLAEERLSLMKKELACLKQIVAEKVPQSGQLKQSVGVRFNVTGRWYHENSYRVGKDLTDPEGQRLCLWVEVRTTSNDRYTMYCRFRGTKQEILDEIDRMIENPEECVEKVQKLSDDLATFYYE